MPLIHGGTPSDISANIREMRNSGYPQRRAVAAALRTADQYGKSRAAGGSAGAPNVPTYQTAAPAVNSAGFVPVPQGGNFGLDQNTGALTPQTQAMLQQFAMRGLPNGPTPPPPVAAPPSLFADPNAGISFSGGAGDPGGKRGGRVGRFASGGVPTSAEMAPWYTRSEARAADHPSGLIHTSGPGRTDNVPLSVAAGSHVIPADVVAGLGEGNTLAGAHALGTAMRGGPGGIKLPSGPHRNTIPKPPAMSHLASGGEPHWEGHSIKVARGGAAKGVKCIVAGGEWIMSPHEVEATKHQGKHGHEAVDAWIVERRKLDVKKLRKLRPPVGMK